MNLQVKTISRCGYSNCVELKNHDVAITIEPNCGGRIIEYSFRGENIIYLNPQEDGYLLKSGKPPLSDYSPCGGRCDIGPETTTEPHPVLYLGKWDVIHADELGIIIRSQKDKVTGIQLERFFKLSEKSSHLTFTQTIRNVSDEVRTFFHWSRTFALGGGIVIAPVNPQSRFPKGYVMYREGHLIDYLPDDEPNIVLDHELIIKGPPSAAKFALDQSEGWLAYVSKTNLLFLKKFHVYPDKNYGEIVANNVSIWYNGNEMCELEPIGPVEVLKPKAEKSFTEEWWLMPYNYEQLLKTLNTEELKDIINAL